MAVDVSELPSRSARSRSLIATIVDKLVAIVGVVPYALIALGLRFIIARVFFLSGQLKIAGPVVAVPLPGGGTFPVTLLAEIKPSTFELFATDYAALPMSPGVAATLFSYAEFVLPVCLVVGFATRLSALALLVMTVMIQVYVAPEALWSAHIYLIAILMVLMSVGPGAISFDALLRYVYQK
jgi:putative oxidoreductase